MKKNLIFRPALIYYGKVAKIFHSVRLSPQVSWVFSSTITRAREKPAEYGDSVTIPFIIAALHPAPPGPRRDRIHCTGKRFVTGTPSLLQQGGCPDRQKSAKAHKGLNPSLERQRRRLAGEQNRMRKDLFRDLRITWQRTRERHRC